jgi:hypothetical protein
MSSNHQSSASTQADTVVALALLKEALVSSPSIGVPPTVTHSHKKPRKPIPGNALSSSAFRPHVLACDHFHLWSAPHSDLFRLSALDQLPLNNVLQLFDIMLVSIEIKTRENYGASLLCFHQYCDLRHIPESQCMPASNFLLASFIASWAGEGTKSDCGVRNQSLDVRSTTLLVRQYVGSRCA